MHRSTHASLTVALFLLSLMLPAFPSAAGAAAAGAVASKSTDSDGGSIWGASYFPDVSLTSHQGKQQRFFSDLIKGKVVVINFIYTSCPDECSLETARIREVQKILGDRVGKDVFLYSITIDPQHDTPKLLKEYAEKFEVGPGWLFLTGKDADITQLRVKLGLYSPQEKDGKLQDHNLSLIIGNQSTGQWMKISPHENPYIMATQIGSWLHNWKIPPKDVRNYGDAPKVRNISLGESLYRIRCAACHKIGSQVADHPIGPDLLDISKKRAHGWLTRWLMEPDKMLAEKDPLATELLIRYNNLPMPNMRLSVKDAEALLDYIDEESSRIGPTIPPKSAKEPQHPVGH
jgi:protein SCO1